jgi:hypothetical protein
MSLVVMQRPGKTGAPPKGSRIHGQGRYCDCCRTAGRGHRSGCFFVVICGNAIPLCEACAREWAGIWDDCLSHTGTEAYVPV